MVLGPPSSPYAVSCNMPDLLRPVVEKNFALKFGWVSTSAEVIGALERRAATHDL